MVDLGKYDDIIIWGAAFPSSEIGGEATSPGRSSEKLIDLLAGNGYKDKIRFFVDSNKKLWGKKRLGIAVEKPEKILEYPDALVIINSLSQNEILKSLSDLPARNDCMIVPYYYYHGLLDQPYDYALAREHTLKYKTKIEKLFDRNDIQTVKRLKIIFELREKAEDDLYPQEFYAGTGDKLSYFCDEKLAPKGDVTMIDVGAYTGDSIEPVRKMYGERLKRCLAFEPDPESVIKLQKYVKEKGLEDKVRIFPVALGNENGMVHFTADNMASQISDTGSIEVKAVRFDDLEDIDLVGDVMVKMDVEGAEMDVLRGMEKMIKDKKPYLAVCLYHKEEDLYDIPKYLKELCPEYRLFLRGGLAS